jgi:outer membrane protein OmpA-like peptidoglycan-associated protein
LLVLAFFAGTIFSFGQDFLPTLNDNYMGIDQVFLQPAAIAGSSFKADFNVAGFSNDILNDGIRFRSRWILYPTQIISNDKWWDENTYLAPANGKDKSMFMSQSAIGPSFMVSLDSQSKYAIGFTSRVRSLTNIDGMDEPLFRMIYSNYTEKDYYNKWFYDKEMRANQHVIGDYGLTFAMAFSQPFNFIHQGHYLKAGATMKLLQGIAGSYIQTNDLYYYFNGQAYPQSKDISFNSPYVEAGLSDNWGDIDQYNNYSFSMNYQFTAKPSLGADLGIVFVLLKNDKPKKSKENQYTDLSSIELADTGFVTIPLAFIDSAYANPSKSSNSVYRSGKRAAKFEATDYLAKFGISVLDIGSVTYTKDYYSSDLITSFTPDYLQRYNINDNSVPANTNWLDANSLKFNFENYVPFSQEMYQRKINGQGVQDHPYNKEKFYCKLPTALSLQADVNMFLEGLFINFTAYQPLVKTFRHVPNSHYITNLSITPRYERRWYSIAVPVQYNEYNKWEVGLGVRAGIFYFGVNNLFSNVFSDPYGISAYAGVKIPIYHKDHSKTYEQQVSEPMKYQSVPCNHNTAIHDENQIIKDSFNNTIISDDHSINITGNRFDSGNKVPSGENGGDNQSKNSGSSNKNEGGQNGNSGPGGSGQGGTGQGQGQGKGKGDDLKPNNSHIPLLNELILPEPPLPAYAPIHFAFGDAKNSQSDLDYLNALASMLKENPNLKVTIEGHTDNVGSEAYNLKLSKIRAEETMNYLLKQGVNKDQLAIAWFGESRPLGIKTQDTEEGRKANRRVEFVFERKT